MVVAKQRSRVKEEQLGVVRGRKTLWSIRVVRSEKLGFKKVVDEEDGDSRKEIAPAFGMPAFRVGVIKSITTCQL